MKERFYYFLLTINCLYSIVLYFPFVLLTNAEKGLPFALLFGLMLACIFAYLLLYVFNHYKDKNFFQICEMLFGKKFGKVVSVGYMFLRFTISGFYFAGAVKAFNLYLLPRTPAWFIALLLTLPLYIITKQSRKNYLHSIAFFTVIIIPWYILIFIIGFQNIDFRYIKGTIIHSLNIPKLSMIGVSIFYFTGVQHLAVFNSLFKNKLNLKKTLMIYCFVGLPFALVSLSIPLGVWGPEAIKTLKYLETITMDTMDIDVFFIERVLFLAAPLLSMIIIINIANYTYVGIEILKDMGASKKFYKITLFTVFLAYILFATYVGPIERLYYSASVFSIVWLIIHTLKVLLLYFGTKRKEGKKT